MNFKIKPTYLAIGAAVVLSACTHDDMPGSVDESSRRVMFSTSVPGISSRAEVIVTDNLPYFQVTAFDNADKDTLFSNARIDVVSTRDFQYSPKCIWPDPGKESNNVSFFAFHPGLEKLGKDAVLPPKPTAGSLDYKLTGFSVAPEITDQVDFITAYAAGSMEYNLFSGIRLPFSHQLSRIEIKAYSAHKSCDIEIAGVRIGEIYRKGTFTFATGTSGSSWSEISDKGKVEHIFSKGDKVVTLKKGSTSTSTKDGAVSLMGNAYYNGNSAMLLPYNYPTAWDCTNDRPNSKKGMYISVLLRVIDATPTAGITPPEKQRYPYRDIRQGLQSLDNRIPRVYLAVKKNTGVVSCQVYKKSGTSYNQADTKYYAADGSAYNVPADEEVKEFGWAAVPVTGNWAPGYAYTYTLNYSQGVGLHGPDITTSEPGAGDPIIGDKVDVFVTVRDWVDAKLDPVDVPGS